MTALDGFDKWVKRERELKEIGLVSDAFSSIDDVPTQRLRMNDTRPPGVYHVRLQGIDHTDYGEGFAVSKIGAVSLEVFTPGNKLPRGKHVRITASRQLPESLLRFLLADLIENLPSLNSF